MKRFCGICLLLLLFCGCQPERENAYSGNGNYVAMVGEQKLYEYEYRFQYSRVLEEYLENHEEPDESVLAQLREEALTRAYREKIAWMLAVEAGFTLSEEELEAVHQTVERHASYCLETYPHEATLEEILSFVYGGISNTQYEQIVQKQTLVQKYREEAKANFSLGEREAKDHYLAYEAKYKTVSLRALYYKKGELSQQEWEQTVQRAQGYMGQITSDEDMTALVLAESQEAGVEDTGGRYVLALHAVTEDSIFYSFVTDPTRKAGDMAMVEGTEGLSLLRCIAVEDYDSSVTIRTQVLQDLEEACWQKHLEERAGQEAYQLSKVQYDELALL